MVQCIDWKSNNDRMETSVSPVIFFYVCVRGIAKNHPLDTVNHIGTLGLQCTEKSNRVDRLKHLACLAKLMSCDTTRLSEDDNIYIFLNSVFPQYNLPFNQLKIHIDHKTVRFLSFFLLAYKPLQIL